MEEQGTINSTNKNYFETLTYLRLLSEGHISRDVAAEKIGLSTNELTSYISKEADYSLEEITNFIIQDLTLKEEKYAKLKQEWLKELSELTLAEKNVLYGNYLATNKYLDAIYTGAYIGILLLLRQGAVRIEDAAAQMNVPTEMLIPYVRQQSGKSPDDILDLLYLSSKILKKAKKDDADLWEYDGEDFFYRS